MSINKVDNSIFMKSLAREAVPRTPLWIMRQAGRYLPEYRQVRQQAGDFLTLCKTPDLACEVTLQPLARFKLDAAILFSDILTIPDAMGLGLHFIEGEGPKFRNPISSTADVTNLAHTDNIMNELGYVMNAASLIRQEMPADLPLIGFSGSPWTLACYMVEGQATRDFKKTFKFMYLEPQAMHALLSRLADAVFFYLEAQVKAGVNALMIFDTWGGILSSDDYLSFSLAHMEKIVQRLKEKYPHLPIILFTKGGGQWLSAMAATGCDALGLDWTCDIAKARAEVGQKVALQGNLNPAVLLTSPECIREQVGCVLKAFGKGSGHIFNLGHGITPDVNPENVTALIEALHELSPEYHKLAN